MPVATAILQNDVPLPSAKVNEVNEQVQPKPSSSTSPSSPPLIDLYSASGEAKKDSALELKKQILKGLKGFENDIVPGDVNSAQDLAFKFKR